MSAPVQGDAQGAKQRQGGRVEPLWQRDGFIRARSSHRNGSRNEIRGGLESMLRAGSSKRHTTGCPDVVKND